MPWNELLANLAIVALSTSIWTAGFGYISRNSRIRQQLLMGGLAGAATLLAMLLPFQFIPGVLLDLRYTLIAVAGFFGGPAAALVPLVVAVAKRLMSGGTGIWVAMPNISMAFAFGCAGHSLLKRKVPSARDLVILSLAVVISGCLGFFLMVPMARWPAMIINVVAPFSLILFVSTFFSGLAIAQEIRRQRVLKENWTYRAVIDALPDCLNAKDLDGRFVAANPATAELMLAPDVEALIGKSDADFYPAETAAIFRQREIDRVLEGPKVFEERVVRPDGRSVWLSTLKAPFSDTEGNVIGVITHNREITDTKRLELALSETQLHLTDALSGMADGLALFDADGVLVFSNDRYVEMFPMTADVRVPGNKIEAIVAVSLERNEIVFPNGRPVETVEDIVGQLTAKSGAREIAMADGRWLQARTRSTHNGGSMVIFSDVSIAKASEQKLRELNERLFQLAHTDGLTGLTNRRAFDTRLDEAIGRAMASGQDVGLLMIDVDKFKIFNDTYGHPAGDECLRRVADCLKVVAEELPGITVGRYGGEEFGIVLPNLNLSESASVGRLLMAAVRALGTDNPADPVARVTVSVGVAALNDVAGFRGAHLLQRADAALYRAKASGRDCIRLNDTDIPLKTVSRPAER